MPASKLLMVMFLMLMLGLTALSSIANIKCCCSTIFPKSKLSFTPDFAKQYFLNTIISSENATQLIKGLSKLPPQFLKKLYQTYTKQNGIYSRMKPQFATESTQQLLSNCQFVKFVRSGRRLQSQPRRLPPEDEERDKFYQEIQHLYIVPYLHSDSNPNSVINLDSHSGSFVHDVSVIQLSSSDSILNILDESSEFIIYQQVTQILAIPELKKRMREFRCHLGYQKWVKDVATYLFDNNFYAQVIIWLEKIIVPVNRRTNRNAFETWARAWFRARGMNMEGLDQFVCRNPADQCTNQC